MKVIVDLCVVPIGVGVHLAPYIAACEKVLTEAGLKIQLHPNGTAIEGEWEPVFAAIEACHQAVHAMGCPRIYTTVKINTPPTDKEQTGAIPLNADEHSTTQRLTAMLHREQEEVVAECPEVGAVSQGDTVG